MSLLSANTLFHFTNLENLLSILKNGFQPRYHEEDMSLFRDFNQNIAFPMVCFCDIPLSLIGKHLEKHGGCGIGLTKKWGIDNRISPVMYCVQDSQASNNLKNGLAFLTKFISNRTSLFHGPEIELTPSSSLDELKKFTYFMKDVYFYDEKEWRFVLQEPEEYIIPSLNQGKKLDSFMEKLNSSPSPEFLGFESHDIKYIIINNFSEIDEVVREIDKLRKFNKTGRNFLKTRLLTSKDILEDF